MSDDPGTRDPTGRARVDVTNLHDLRYWASALGVTPVDLRMAVAEVGASVATLKKYFEKRRAL